MAANMKSKVLSFCLMMVMAAALTSGISFNSLGADQDIVVLYTNDVHCGVDDNLGYAGLALYKKQMLKQTPYVTLVDAGDAIQGAPIGTLSEGGYPIDIMNKTGYDFAVPGNHEFDYGMERFLELSRQLKCGYFSCNFTNLSTNGLVFDPYKIITYGDTKVAYLGITTPESFTKSTPAYFQDAAGNYIYSFGEDESGQRLYSLVQAGVDAAREEGADYVILVGHLGENGVTQRWTSDEVIRNTNGIDACIDGHSHETVPGRSVPNKDGKNISITQTGTKLKHIGRLTIKPDGTITTELISQVLEDSGVLSYTVKKGDTLGKIAKRELGSFNRWPAVYQANRDRIKNPDLLSIGMNLAIPGESFTAASGKPVDYATDQYIRGIQAQFQETLKTVLGYTEYELTVNDPETKERRIRNAETNLGDLAADAYRYVLGAEIGLCNGGGIRDNIKTGAITYLDVLNVFPFGSMGCVVEATGRQLVDALEMAAKNYPFENGSFLQVSGLTYTIDSSVLSGVEVDEKGNFVQVNGAYRVHDIMVNGEPIDLARTYTVASHNYLLKSGGDGMTMFKQSSVLKDEVMADVDLFSGYINKELGGSIGADYSNPAGQGRIKFK